MTASRAYFPDEEPELDPHLELEEAGRYPDPPDTRHDTDAYCPKCHGWQQGGSPCR